MLAGCFPLLYGFLLSLLIFLSFPVTIATNVSASLSIVKIGALFDEENVSRYSGVLTRSIEELNGSVAGVQLDEPVILGASSNPGHILSLVCDEMITKNVSAILAISTETTLFSLSMVGEFLSTPIVGIGSRSFSFSNKNVHPMYLRLESAESFQAYAIKKILHRNGWFQYSILASEETPSQAFLQYLTNVTSSLTWTVKGTVFSRDKRDIDHVLHSAAKSKTRVFVLHATPEYSSLLFRAAKDFGLLDAGNVWIVAETVITNQPQYLKHYPIGLIAVQFVDSGHIESKIHDSVELIARASVNKNYISNIASNKSCWSKPTPDKLEYGREFYSALVQTSFMGQTGYINLDEEGNLNNATYIILNLVKDQNRLSYWKELGKWENGDFSMEAIIWPGNSVSLPNGVNTEKVLIVANIEKPFIVVSTPLDVSFDCLTGVLCLQAVNGTREDIEKAFAEYDEPTVHGNYTDMKRCCSGLGIDLIESLRIDVEFNYNLYLVADENHGAFENGQWNGMVADLLNGTADLALSSFSITSERSRVIDFSSPFFHSGFSTLVAKKQVEPQLDSFLEPLDWSVWILVFVTVNIVAIAITIFEWMSPYGLHPRGRNRHYTFGLPSALNIAFSILFSHTVKSKPPKCMTSRFLLNVWGAFSFIFFASYTANLAAYMAGQTSHLQIDGINDEKFQYPLRKGIKFATQNGSSCENYIMENWPDVGRFMEPFNVEDADQAIEHIK
ncbi:glutamate receptor ionotropic, NMDA 3A-like [Saccoglossus kowalevskii]